MGSINFQYGRQLRLETYLLPLNSNGWNSEAHPFSPCGREDRPTASAQNPISSPCCACSSARSYIICFSKKLVDCVGGALNSMTKNREVRREAQFA